MEREVKRELLDELPAGDRRAIGSRRDLKKVNACMGHARIMGRTLVDAFAECPPRSIVDLGGGDGTLLLRLAKYMGPCWQPSRVVLVDRQKLLSPATKAEFEALSWRVENLESDVFDWLERPNPDPTDVTVTSLFLHHFKKPDLRRLLTRAAEQTRFFLACEPQRAHFALCGASLLGFIGCNDVTRYDAKVSVRAGFAEQELSSLWPAGNGWRLRERKAGLFTHCFVAQRIEEQPS
jgi:hypothetical protein